jgi:mRNA-degrading endonuclease RelE of RelBE toxin-antitoxin system
MAFKLRFTKSAEEQLHALKADSSKKRILKDVIKALRYMEVDLRHPSLNTHEYYNLKGAQGEKIFEAYAQQRTPGAYRIFWHYGPEKNIISIIAIIPHP